MNYSEVWVRLAIKCESVCDCECVRERQRFRDSVDMSETIWICIQVYVCVCMSQWESVSVETQGVIVGGQMAHILTTPPPTWHLLERWDWENSLRSDLLADSSQQEPTRGGIPPALAS